GPAEVGLGIAAGDLADLMDDFHRGERLVGSPGGAAILAPFAGGAGVGVEDVFPGQITDRGGAELFGRIVFEVDGGDEALRFKRRQKGVDAGGEDVAQLGVGDGVEEAEHQDEVEPPEDLVGHEQGAGVHCGKELSRQHAAGGEACQLGVQLQFGGGHARPFDQEPGDQDGEQQLQDDVVVPDDLQPFGPDDESADEESGQHQDGEDAGDIQHQRERLVEFAGEEVDLQQGGEEVGLEHDKQRADEEHQEAPEEDGMEHAAVGDAEDLRLAEYFGEHPLDPFVVAVEAVQRLTLAPDRQALPKSPGHAAEGGKGQNIHRDDDPVADIPVNLTGSFHNKFLSR